MPRGRQPHPEQHHEESALVWQAASDVVWLSVVPASGDTPADPELRVDPQGLPAGDYEGVVTIHSDGPGGPLPAQQVRVSLTVTGGAAAQRRLYLPLVRR